MTINTEMFTQKQYEILQKEDSILKIREAMRVEETALKIEFKTDEMHEKIKAVSNKYNADIAVIKNEIVAIKQSLLG